MKAIVLCAAIFLGAASLPPAYAAAGATLSKIDVALSRGDGAAAQRLAQTGLAAGNLSALARARLSAGLGRARALEGARNSALLIFTQVINAGVLPPAEQARLLFDRGRTLMALGRGYDAIGDYSAALAIAPGMAKVRSDRAGAYLRLGQYAQARADYQTLLAKGGASRAQCYFSLAQIAELQGDRDAARDYYARAIAADSASAGAQAASFDGSDSPAKPAAGPDDGVIILHPPVPRPAQARARLPLERSSPIVSVNYKPASYKEGGDAVGLRPAIGWAVRGPQVQLGAWHEKSQALQGWNHALSLAGGDLAGFTPHILVVDLPDRGRYYRLRVTTANKASAHRLCARLHAKGLACILAHD